MLGQWAETDAQGVAPANEDELYCAVTGHWNRLPRETVECPSLEMSKNCLNTILCKVI